MLSSLALTEWKKEEGALVVLLRTLMARKELGKRIKELLSTFFLRGGIFEAGCEHFKSKIRQLEERHREPVRAKDRRNRGLRLNLFSHGPQHKLISQGTKETHPL